MKMKIVAVGILIIPALVMSTMLLTPPTTLLASGKGLTIYLTIQI